MDFDISIHDLVLGIVVVHVNVFCVSVADIILCMRDERLVIGE